MSSPQALKAKVDNGPEDGKTYQGTTLGDDHVSPVPRERSRPRSRSPNSFRSQRGRSRSRTRSRSRSRGRDRSRSPAPSLEDSFRSRRRSRSRDPAANEIDGRHSPSDSRSRPPSLDIPAVQRKVTFTEATKPGPRDERVPGSSKDRIHLDREAPGDFVIRHHRDSLVVRLKDYEPGKLQSTVAGMKTKISNLRPGKSPSDDDKDDEEAQRKKNAAAASGDGKRFRISFAEVQRMKIRKLQCQLVRHVVKMRLDGHESPGWEDTLEKYIKALQDHDYMEKRSKSIRDPFLATGEYAVDNYVLNCNIDNILADDSSIKLASSPRPWEPHQTRDPLHNFEPICGTRSGNIARTWYHGFKNRVVLAALGGAFLIGPMWLMVLKAGDLTGLIATTGFVAAFGITMAYFLEEGKDVLASTAAYAAVLVVFVGTSTSSQTDTSG